MNPISVDVPLPLIISAGLEREAVLRTKIHPAQMKVPMVLVQVEFSLQGLPTHQGLQRQRLYVKPLRV